jgi:drug/metabolite transporter (DMT)-like permease
MTTTLLPPSRTPLSRSTLAVLGLLLVTAAWGSTFFMLKGVIERVPVTDFLAVRFVVAALALWLLFPRAVSRLSAPERRQAVVLGVVYGAAQILQTLGLQSTSASVSGFVTGMYVVFTPLLGAVLLRARVGLPVWAAVALATAGLGVLSLQGLAVGGGELLTLLGALLYAVHIVGLGVWSRPGSALGLTVLQLATISVVCALGALPGGLTLPSRSADWLALLYMALVAGALALVVQTWAQAHLAATRAAIIMTMEPVWAALFAVLFGGESLGLRVLLGGVLVLAAMYLAELGPRRPEEQDVAEEIGRVTHVGPV